MPMPSLNRSKKAAASPAEELEQAYDSHEQVPEVAEVRIDPGRCRAPSANEPDEFDIAAEVVKDSAAGRSDRFEREILRTRFRQRSGGCARDS